MFALAALWAVASPVVAQTELGHYGGGAGGQMKVAVLPPPGFVVENGTLGFFASEFIVQSPVARSRYQYDEPNIRGGLPQQIRD